MTHHSPCTLVKFMNNANISFPLKIKIGAEQTWSCDLGTYWATPILTYDLINVTSYITGILPIL